MQWVNGEVDAGMKKPVWTLHVRRVQNYAEYSISSPHLPLSHPKTHLIHVVIPLPPRLLCGDRAFIYCGTAGGNDELTITSTA